MVHTQGEVSGHVLTHIDDHLAPLLQRGGIERLDGFGGLHAPPLKCRRVGHAAHDTHGMVLRAPQFGHRRGSLLKPCGTAVAHPHPGILRRNGRNKAQKGDGRKAGCRHEYSSRMVHIRYFGLVTFPFQSDHPTAICRHGACCGDGAATFRTAACARSHP